VENVLLVELAAKFEMQVTIKDLLASKQNLVYYPVSSNIGQVEQWVNCMGWDCW